MVNDEDIKLIVAASGDVREACRRLIQRANERGGEDNITAVIIKIEEVGDEEAGVVPTDTPAHGAADRRRSANGSR
jgi:protein phosphatase